MARLLTRAAAVLLVALAAAPAAAKDVVIRWHGQSFFEVISPEGLRIVLDPHAIEEYGRISVKADLILMSHLHNDHAALDQSLQLLTEIDDAWNASPHDQRQPAKVAP